MPCKTLLATVVLAALLWCAEVAAQGNPCEANRDQGDDGCGINPQAVQHQTVSGAIDFAGTEYDARCATGRDGCTVHQPMLRFWEEDNFDNANSGVALQTNRPEPLDGQPGPRLRFRVGDRHLDHQVGQLGLGIQGCPTTGRTAAEVSWCDTTTGEAWYVVASVWGPAYDFDRITGPDIGPMGEPNLLPLTRVPLPAARPAAPRDIEPAPKTERSHRARCRFIHGG